MNKDFNVYDVDKRHPATVVKQENPDYEYKKQFLSRIGKNSDYPKLSIKKNIRNRLYF